VDNREKPALSPEFPQRFDVAVAPENKHIELSRVVSILICALTAIAIALCVALYFAKQYQSSKAWLLIVGNNSDEWSLIKEQDSVKKPEVVSDMQIIQESAAIDFVRKWFRVLGSKTANDSNWKTCVLDKCALVSENMSGSLCCQTTQDVFARFSNDYANKYREYVASGITQLVLENDVYKITTEKMAQVNGGLALSAGNVDTVWRLDFSVQRKYPNAAAQVDDIVAFVRVSKNASVYWNAGAFVSEFYYFIKESK
jgi:hypothetical protein